MLKTLLQKENPQGDLKKDLLRRDNRFRLGFLKISTDIGLAISLVIGLSNLFNFGLLHPVTLLIITFGLSLGWIRFYCIKHEKLELGCKVLMVLLTALVLLVPFTFHIHDLSGSFYFMPIMVMLSAFLFGFNAATWMLGILVGYNLLFASQIIQQTLLPHLEVLHPQPWPAAIDKIITVATAYLVSISFLKLKSQHEDLILTQQEELFSQKRMNSLAIMAGGIAHELNNPLGIVYGSHKILRKLCKDLPETESWIDKSDEGLKRVEGVIKAIQMFSGSLHQTQTDPIFLNPIIRKTATEVTSEMLVPENRVIIHCPENAELHIPRDHLELIISNLLKNAIEASKTDQEITLNVKYTPGYSLKLVLRNPSPPIPKEEIQKFFDPFYTTKEIGKGPGMGLTIVFGLVSSNGGTISASYEKGNLVFTIEFPIHFEQTRIAV